MTAWELFELSLFIAFSVTIMPMLIFGAFTLLCGAVAWFADLFTGGKHADRK